MRNFRDIILQWRKDDEERAERLDHGRYGRDHHDRFEDYAHRSTLQKRKERLKKLLDDKMDDKTDKEAQQDSQQDPKDNNNQTPATPNKSTDYNKTESENHNTIKVQWDYDARAQNGGDYQLDVITLNTGDVLDVTQPGIVMAHINLPDGAMYRIPPLPKFEDYQVRVEADTGKAYLSLTDRHGVDYDVAELQFAEGYDQSMGVDLSHVRQLGGGRTQTETGHAEITVSAAEPQEFMHQSTHDVLAGDNQFSTDQSDNFKVNYDELQLIHGFDNNGANADNLDLSAIWTSLTPQQEAQGKMIMIFDYYQQGDADKAADYFHADYNASTGMISLQDYVGNTLAMLNTNNIDLQAADDGQVYLDASVSWNTMEWVGGGVITEMREVNGVKMLYTEIHEPAPVLTTHEKDFTILVDNLDAENLGLLLANNLGANESGPSAVEHHDGPRLLAASQHAATDHASITELMNTNLSDMS